VPMNLAIEGVALPARLRFERPMTDDELFKFCGKNELLRVERDSNGELILQSLSGLVEASANAEITTDLRVWAREDSRGKSFGSNVGFTLPDGSMRSPSGAWMSLQQWNALTPWEQKRFGHVVPEFVIELRSRTDRLAELQKKMSIWISNGVELAWLIDPKRKVVEVYRAGEPVEVHQNPSSVQGSGPVRGFELVMDRIWS
jgi:Uma2 family endonuclease